MAAAPVRLSETIEFIKNGQITIPKKVREKHNIVPGQKGTLIELGEGFLIVPTSSQIPEMLDEIRERLGTAGMSLEEMITEMRSIRETSNYEAKAK